MLRVTSHTRRVLDALHTELKNCHGGNSAQQVTECWEIMSFLDILKRVAVENEEQRPN